MSVSKTFASAVGAAMLAFGAVAAADAAVIYPVSAVGSSSYPGYNDFYAVDTGPGSEFTDWSSLGQGANARLNLDLGGAYTIDTAYVTDRVTSGGGNGCQCFGTTDFTTMFSLQAFTDATFSVALGSAYVFNHATPVNPSSPAAFLSVAATPGLAGRYIQYRVLANNPGNGNTGLSDIHFAGSDVSASGAVPEPGAWVLMITGFGAAGAMLRRRRALAFAKI